jgi:hypothetical protein
MHSVAVLRAVSELLARPEHWIQWADARTVTGVATHADDPAAMAWSLRAALQVVSRRVDVLDHDHVRVRATELLEEVIGSLLDPWNDAPHRVHADVLAALEQAIVRARNRP